MGYKKAELVYFHLLHQNMWLYVTSLLRNLFLVLI